jgi:phage gpG-like protein
MYNEARKILNDLRKFEAELPAVVSEMGAIGLNHFIKSFRNQGFEDTTVEKWQKRKRDRDPGRGILIGKGSGHLRRSLRKIPLGKYGVNIVSDLPYAKIHNDGLWGKAYGKYPFKMPRRQFMGYSRNMSNKIERMINRHVKKVF